MKKDARGFTLLELLVVIAILGILASIGVAHFMRYKTKSINSIAENDLRNAVAAQEAYYVDEGTYASCDGGLVCEGTLPGFKTSKESDGSSAMQIFQFESFGERFTGRSLHLKGTITYSYDSDGGVIVEN